MLKTKLRTAVEKLGRGAGLALVLLLSDACHMLPDPADFVVFPEAHSRNLSELHSADGSYKYSGILLGDFGYLAEEMRGADRATHMSPVSISSPSNETLANLTQLLSADSTEPAARAEQLQWCVRLVQSDASDLVREIAAEGLAHIGLSLGITELKAATPPQGAASPDDIAAAFELLLRDMRLSIEAGEETAGFQASCERTSALRLDIDGAWRMHKFATELQAIAVDASAGTALYALIRELETTLISLGLRKAVSDGADRVALTGLTGYVQISGSEELIPYLTRPELNLKGDLLYGLLRLLRIYGLPEAGVTNDVRTACFGSLMSWATEHPSARVRVQAMLALQELAPDGPRSVREEDWAQWQASIVLHLP